MSEAVAKNIISILKVKGFEHKISDHEPVFTSQQAADVRGAELKTGVKAMVLKTPEGKFILALCPADIRVDIKELSGREGVKKLNLATPEEVKKITDCEVGSVPPFGHKRDLKTYMFRGVLENEWVNFNIGLHTKSAHMKSVDLKEIIDTIIV